MYLNLGKVELVFKFLSFSQTSNGTFPGQQFTIFGLSISQGCFDVSSHNFIKLGFKQFSPVRKLCLKYRYTRERWNEVLRFPKSFACLITRRSQISVQYFHRGGKSLSGPFFPGFE